ncbi:MAG: hypothetical protein ACMG57_00210 [Candidatus Dojkabacteria bacterium]
MATRRKKKQKNELQLPKWAIGLIIGIVMVFGLIAITAPKNESTPKPISKQDPYNQMWADELNLHLGGCNIASDTAWTIEWFSGTGAQTKYGYSSENGCVRIDKVLIGSANTDEQIKSLIKKEALSAEVNQMISVQLGWNNVNNFMNPLGNYEADVLGDYLAYRLLGPKDQVVLQVLAPGNYPTTVWDQKIDCTTLKEANLVSTMRPNLTIPGGISSILKMKGC